MISCTSMYQIYKYVGKFRLFLGGEGGGSAEILQFRNIITSGQEIKFLLPLASGITPHVYQNLIESMPRRIKTVIGAKSGHTKY